MENIRKERAVEAVIFDLDGVLIDSEWIGFQAWQAVVRSYGGVLEDSAYAGIVGLTQERSAEYAMEHSGIHFDLEESCALSWEWIIAKLKTDIRPLPGASELVQALAGRGCPLAIASNGITRYIESALEGLGLTAFFPIRVGVDQVAQGKPEPDVYLSAAHRLGVNPRRCLAVEDSRVGVRAANAAGLRAIAVPGPHDREQANYAEAWRIFPSLLEVNNALDELLS